MRPSQPLRYSALGSYLGFPECCVAAFSTDFCATTKNLYPEGPWMGTGFIPCACCAEEALNFDKFVAERITPNRLCASPFPDATDERVDAMTALFDEIYAPRVAPPMRMLMNVDSWTRQHTPVLHDRISRLFA
jgi:hypothetical protein